MKILLFSGSLRKDSLNKKLLSVIDQLIKKFPDCETRIADLKSLSIPVYDGDIEAEGIPQGVLELGKMIKEADAIITCSPEYNGSIAGSLKNTIDWVSRIRPVPLEKKPILLTGASPGAFGSIRALGQTRAPFEALGSYVYPQSFALPKAHEAFSTEGTLVDQGTEKKLEGLLLGYLEFAKRLKA
ncbi:NADPH-dependent FMN reductase [Peredibacter sp. HCB2-198]|uniref:NADPH-dependent FMN reductase n=1 Tax=Peredibacter sp. HCB2-198 TaxID=3383025 RepID=UPI0038B49857